MAVCISCRSDLWVYYHDVEGPFRAYLVAFPLSSSSAALDGVLRYGRQLQAFVNLDAWPEGEGPPAMHPIGESPFLWTFRQMPWQRWLLV